MSVEVRVSVRAAGEVHRLDWVPATGVTDDTPDAEIVARSHEQLDGVLDEGGLLPLPFPVDARTHRLLAVRAIEWVDVEVRRLAEWISTREAAELLGVSRQRVLQLRDEHEGFPAPRGDEHRFEWPRAELVAWQEARRAGGAQA